MEHNKLEELLKNYEIKHSEYLEFASRLKQIFEDVLNSKNLPYLPIEARAKTPTSLRIKLESGVINPSTLEEVQDLAGVRITTYVYEDITSIEELISENFESKPLEIEQRLGVDRVGYRSHHWTIALSTARLELPEYKKFKGLKAELQVRTILQHAWAQIGHNQIYKPNVVLPDKIKRDFTLLAGLLEIADNEFSRISKEISSYSTEIGQRADRGDLNVPIDSISLRAYFEKRFSAIRIEQKFGPRDDMAEQIIEELKLIGISTLEQLDNLIPKDFDSNIVKFEKNTNYCGIARDIMIIAKPENYFKNAWRNSWILNPKNPEDLLIYKHYNVDVPELMKRFDKTNNPDLK